MQDEQKRFEDLFRRAATNLKKYGQPVDYFSINMIMIGLPPSVSISTAKKWLENKFNKDNSSISGVYLSRTIPVTEMNKGSSTTQPLNEVALVLNQNARVKWTEFIPKDFVLNVNLKFGKISEEESKTVLIMGDKQIETGSCYLFQRGQIYHEHISEEISYEFQRHSGIESNFIFSLRPNQEESIMLSAIFPPEDAFLII